MINIIQKSKIWSVWFHLKWKLETDKLTLAISGLDEWMDRCPCQPPHPPKKKKKKKKTFARTNLFINLAIISGGNFLYLSKKE